MDNQNQISPPKESSKEKTFPIVLAVLIIAILLIAIPFGLQAEFFTSKKEVAKVTTSITPLPKNVTNRDVISLVSPQLNQQFRCPTVISFCRQQSYFINGALEVWTHEEPLFAAIAGKLLITEEGNAFNKEDYHHIVIMQADGLQAHYFFKGDIVKNSGEVKEGDKIATTNGVPIVLRKDKSLIFEIRKIENGKVIRLKLNSDNFTQRNDK